MLGNQALGEVRLLFNYSEDLVIVIVFWIHLSVTRGQLSGGRGQGSGVSCQLSGDRGQGTGDRRQEAESRRQEN
jgi:hypothetical protein